MKKYDKLVFICTNNTSRGPIAEGIMKQLIGERELEVSSKGLVVLFEEPINPKVIAAAQRYGVHLENNMSRQLHEEDVGDRILLLTMSEQQKRNIYETFENAINVYTLNEFVGGEGDIKDLCGCEMSDYLECFDTISILVNLVAEKLFSEEEELIKQEFEQIKQSDNKEEEE